MTNILAKKAVLANLTISRWGARRFVDNVTDEILDKHHAQKDVGLFTKRLLGKPAMAKLNKITAKARIVHSTLTLPWLDAGIRILPTTLYLKYAQEIGKLKNEFEAALNEFIKKYPFYIKQAEEELGGLFNEADYPKVGNIRHRFMFDVAIMPCPDAGDFRITLDKQDMDEIKQDLESRMDGQLREALGDAAQRIVQTVGHMSEKLKSYKPADKKNGNKAEGKFHDSLIEHVRELIELLPAFNLSNDKDFTGIIERIVAQLSAHDADDLREDEALRKKVAKDADSILKDVQDFLG